MTIKFRTALAHTGGEGSAFRILFENPEGKKPLRRRRSRWEGDIKRDIKKWYMKVWFEFM